MARSVAELFVSILNMSAAGSLVIAVVLCVRAVLRKAPRRAVCWLWAAPVFRLLCPVSVTSALSLLQLTGGSVRSGRLEYISPAVVSDLVPVRDLPAPAFPDVPAAPVPVPSAPAADPVQLLLLLGGCVWLAGIAVMLAAAGVQLHRLHRKLTEAVELEPGVWLADRIEGPFVLGILRPRIYLPSYIPAERREYILAHERAHIRRRDPLRKLLAFAALCLHWFNPLVWLGWRMLCRDIETACDEEALRGANAHRRSRYAAVLLEAAGEQERFPPLLAFGESDVAVRIKRTLCSRPVSRAALLGGLALAAVLTACLATNPSVSPAPRPTYAQAKEALEEYMGYDERRFMLFEIEELSYVEPEKWEETGMLGEMIDSQTSWGDYLKDDPSRCIWFSRTATRYQPETAITAPQASDGGWENYLLLEAEGDGYRVVSSRVCGGMDVPEPPAEYTQSQLGLTTDQWAILQHQVSALVFSGIRRDFSSPSEWTAEELAGWAKCRLAYWPLHYEEDPLPLRNLSMLLQADFSPENESWGDASGLLPAALEGKTELPLGDPPAMPEDEQVSVQYWREGDNIVARAVVADSGGEELCMEYIFGLVPDIGPVSRTWLQSACVLNAKCPVGESSSASLAG